MSLQHIELVRRLAVNTHRLQTDKLLTENIQNIRIWIDNHSVHVQRENTRVTLYDLTKSFITDIWLTITHCLQQLT